MSLNNSESQCHVSFSLLDHLSLRISLAKQDPLKLISVLDCKITVENRFLQKCGDLIDTYQGKVFVDARMVGVPNLLAIKCVRCDPKDAVIRQRVLSALDDEKDKWLLLDHPNLSPVWQLSSSIAAIPVVGTPWYGNGNVIDFICQNPGVDKLALALQVASAVKYIHSKDLTHGNIIPANIMIADDGRACLSDVGLHACLSKVMYISALPIPPGWMFKAPEELLYEYDPVYFAYTEAMDVYAFASSIQMIYTSRPPFPAQLYGRSIMEITSRGRVIERPTEIMSDPLWDLLQLCRSYHPQDRPSMVVVEAALEKL